MPYIRYSLSEGGGGTSLLPQRLSDRNVFYIRLTLSMVILAKSLAGVRLDQLGRSGEETTLLDTLFVRKNRLGGE